MSETEDGFSRGGIGTGDAREWKGGGFWVRVETRSSRPHARSGPHQMPSVDARVHPIAAIATTTKDRDMLTRKNQPFIAAAATPKGMPHHAERSPQNP